jgi:hypothetical protein
MEAEVARFEATGGASALPTIAVDEKKKKKHKYSRGTKSVQQAGRGVRKATARISRAVSKGLFDFYERSEKSGRKRRDGALRDMTENMARAVGSSVRILGKAPYDLARRLPNRLIATQVRAGLRILFPFVR